MPDTVEMPDLAELEPAPAERSPELPPNPPPGLDTALYRSDERAGRRDLRRQIAALEAALGRLFGSAFPRTEIDFVVGSARGGPRILSVDELESVRDALVARLQDVKGTLYERGYTEQKKRGLIEEMLAEPAAHKWRIVSNEDIGEPGCKHWHSRPRWGLLGMIMGWWRVKISSGCPLPAGVAPPPALASQHLADDNEKATAQAPSSRGRGECSCRRWNWQAGRGGWRRSVRGRRRRLGAPAVDRRGRIADGPPGRQADPDCPQGPAPAAVGQLPAQ